MNDEPYFVIYPDARYDVTCQWQPTECGIYETDTVKTPRINSPDTLDDVVEITGLPAEFFLSELYSVMWVDSRGTMEIRSMSTNREEILDWRHLDG